MLRIGKDIRPKACSLKNGFKSTLLACRVYFLVMPI